MAKHQRTLLSLGDMTKSLLCFQLCAAVSSRGSRSRSTKQNQPNSNSEVLGALQTPFSQAPVTQIPFPTGQQYPFTSHLVQIPAAHSKTTLGCEMEHIKDRKTRRFVHQSNGTLKQLHSCILSNLIFENPSGQEGETHITQAEPVKHKGNHPRSDELTQSSESPSRPHKTANWGCMPGLCNAMKAPAQKPG